METKYEIGETYFTANGEKVYLQAITTEGKLVVQQIMRYSDYGDDFYEDVGQSTIVDKVFAEAPVAVLDERFEAAATKLAEIEATYGARYSEVINAEREIKARLSNLQKYIGLDRLEDFIDGKITHVVLPDDSYKIKTLSDMEEMDYGRKQGLPLICLHGDSKGDLTWKINRWKDGSGNWSEIIPASSEEDAQQKRDASVVAKLEEQFKYLADDRPYWFMRTFEVADSLSLEVAVEITAKYRALKTAELEKKKLELETNLAKAQLSLDQHMAQWQAVTQ